MSIPATLQSLSGSGLLAALPLAEQERLLPELHCVTLALGERIYESSGALDYMYFPTSCIVSLVYTMESGVTAEMGLVGKEGAVGLALFMGGETVPNRAVVQLGGKAIRMRAKALQEEFKRGGALQRGLLRYTQALITQISQTAVCNRLHSVEQRLCRWLLLCHDRAESSELRMTHEFIADMLGGRRQSITIAAGRLQSAGLIHYSRGNITILDRQGLEAITCECSRVVKAEFNRLLGAQTKGASAGS
ncbi:MAG: Crp/Fnr family transcriptional regulator [Bryobacteraceae bacterium]|nr:Crp/Fnr family transcriptional regulator [Bryobacteraceae bacterium]